MATLILAIKSSGKVVGRCDERCYLATTPSSKCHCICGGRNHGVGHVQAIEATAEIKRAIAGKPCLYNSEEVTCWIPESAFQRELF